MNVIAMRNTNAIVAIIAGRYPALSGLHASIGWLCTQGCALGYHILAFQAD